MYVGLEQSTIILGVMTGDASKFSNYDETGLERTQLVGFIENQWGFPRYARKCC